MKNFNKKIFLVFAALFLVFAQFNLSINSSIAGVLDAAIVPSSEGGGGGSGSVTSVFGRTGEIVSETGDYTASEVSNVPAGVISATNVQDALNSLVAGPATAVTDADVPLFDGTTGKLLKDSGKIAPVGNFVGTTDKQNLTRKNLQDNSTSIYSNLDPTKHAGFNATALTTDRIFSFPDQGGTFALTSDITGGGYSGFKNFIYNGDFQVNQVAGSASQDIVDGVTSMLYISDTAFGYSTGGNFPLGQRAVGTASPNQYEITGQVGVTTAGIGFRIDGARAKWGSGKDVVLSFYMSNATLTSVNYSIDYADSLNTFGTLDTPSTTNIASGTKTISSTLTRYEVPISSLPSGVGNGIQITFEVGAQTSGVWVIDRVQLEYGSTATDYEQLSYPEQFANCAQFYWQSWGSGSFADGGQVMSNAPVDVSPANVIANLGFPVPMISIPTVTLYDEAGTAGTVSQPGYANGIPAIGTHINYNGVSQVLRSDSSPFVLGAAIRGYVVADSRI